MWPFNKATKAAPQGVSVIVGGQGVASDWKAREYVTEGYHANVIIYRAIREVAEGCKNIPIELRRGDKTLDAHPMLDVLAQPNPMQEFDAWLGEMIINYCIYGEMWALGEPDGRFSEIWALPPSEMVVVPGAGTVPSAYVRERNNHKTRYAVDQTDGTSSVLYRKMHNPADCWRGQSPLMAAALSADTHNAGSRWNYGLLRNGARPTGIVQLPDEAPSDDTLHRMREYFKRALMGDGNAGEVPILSGGANYVEMSKTPMDMDFQTTMAQTAKYIASALGVPLPLIDNDASTFNNLEQAKERFYTDTIIPMMRGFVTGLNRWMVPRWGDDLMLVLDLDDIPALEAVRERTYARATEAYRAGILTREEARDLVGYEPEADGTFFSEAVTPDVGEAMMKAAYGTS